MNALVERGGLAFDLPTLLTRRRALALLGGAGLATLVGCGSDSDGTTATSAAAASATSVVAAATTVGGAVEPAADCATIPEETAGPYPGDGSNGPNVLIESGVVRSDITSSFGSSTTKAEGVPATINLTVEDQSSGCAALAGAAVYLWHCDRDGGYSLYSEGITGENYLRGVQETDADGRASFTSIFPAAYSGRWPHIHFEVYASLEDATGGAEPIATSQLALPEDVCTTVFATSGYEQSVQNMAQTSLSSDNVFSDDQGASQIPTVTGSVDTGYTLELTVPVEAARA